MVDIIGPYKKFSEFIQKAVTRIKELGKSLKAYIKGEEILDKKKDKQQTKEKKHFTKTRKLFGKIGSVMGRLIDVLNNMAFLEVFVDLIGNIFDIISAAGLSSLLPLIQDFMNFLFSDETMELWQTIGELLGSLLEMVLRPLMAFLQPLIPVFKTFGDLLINLFTALTPIFETIGTTLGKALIPIFEILAKVLEAITPVIVVLAEVISGVLGWAIYAFALGVAAIVDAITWIIDMIDFLNLTPIRATNYIGWVEQNLKPTHLAEGGIVTGPSLVVTGEGGEPEKVEPLSKSEEYGFGGKQGMKELLWETERNGSELREIKMLLIEQNRLGNDK